MLRKRQKLLCWTGRYFTRVTLFTLFYKDLQNQCLKITQSYELFEKNRVKKKRKRISCKIIKSNRSVHAIYMAITLKVLTLKIWRSFSMF